MLIRSCVFALAAISVATGSASAQVLFRSDYSQAAYPNCGWSTNGRHEGVRFVRRHAPGEGPSGQNAVELTQRSAVAEQDFGGQYYWGWAGVIEAADPPRSAKRYYRWRMRFAPNSRFDGVGGSYPGPGEPGSLENKLMIVGDGCTGGNCRFILSYQGRQGSGVVDYFRLQTDGGVNHVSTSSFSAGQWLDIQVELDPSSGASTADGGYSIWVNNNNYASPTARRTNIVLNPLGWKYVQFGAYNNSGLASTGVHQWKHTDYEVASSFHTGWHTAGAPSSAPPPAPPQSVRVIQ